VTAWERYVLLIFLLLFFNEFSILTVFVMFKNQENFVKIDKIKNSSKKEAAVC
jgi:hypothetical protein